MLLVFFLFHHDVSLEVIVLPRHPSLLLLVSSFLGRIDEGVMNDVPHTTELLVVVEARIRVSNQLSERANAVLVRFSLLPQRCVEVKPDVGDNSRRKTVILHFLRLILLRPRVMSLESGSAQAVNRFHGLRFCVRRRFLASPLLSEDLNELLV